MLPSRQASKIGAFSKLWLLVNRHCGGGGTPAPPEYSINLATTTTASAAVICMRLALLVRRTGNGVGVGVLELFSGDQRRKIPPPSPPPQSAFLLSALSTICMRGNAVSAFGVRTAEREGEP